MRTMRKTLLKRTGYLLFIVVGIAMVSAGLAQAGPATYQSDEDVIAQGKYLVDISGCEDCHTPFKEIYSAPPEEVPMEAWVTLAFNAFNALDEEKLFAGGHPFEIPGLGVIFSRNLTPDEETGLGSWTDDEIKTAIRTGATPDGRNLFPLMPTHIFNNLANDDLDAIVAYLRSLEPVFNPVPEHGMQLPPTGLMMPEETIVAPDPEDTEARGEYLMTSILLCNDCHTPLNMETFQPDFERYLAGGQPFEGPWGIVYGGNITPDEETGIGSWDDEDIIRVLTSGVRPDGRRLVLMPWQLYANLTPEDLLAVVHYLRNTVEPVSAEVPAADLGPDFIEMVELGTDG